MAGQGVAGIAKTVQMDAAGDQNRRQRQPRRPQRGFQAQPESDALFAAARAAYQREDLRLVPVLRKAAELGVPVMFHANPCRLGFHDNCAPDKINRMIQVFPDLEVITAHLGGSKWPDAVTGCTWTDMSYILPKLAEWYGIEQTNRILRAFGPERLIFGTDFPQGEYEAYFNILDQMDFTDGEIGKIAWGNIAGLLTPEDAE